jgi:hypothetical protein
LSSSSKRPLKIGSPFHRTGANGGQNRTICKGLFKPFSLKTKKSVINSSCGLLKVIINGLENYA